MEDYKDYAGHVLVAVLSIALGAAGGAALTDQTDALQEQGEAITGLNETVSTLETQLASAKETIGQQEGTINSLEGQIEKLEGEKTALQERLDNMPDYQPVVDADSLKYVDYFPGADRDITIPVEVNEEIRGQPKTYFVDYSFEVPAAVEDYSVAVYDSYEGDVRNRIGGGTNGTIEFVADEAGTYYIEMDLELVEDIVYDDADDEKLSENGFTVETEAQNDYYTVVR